jgi:hypothetical protein
MSTEKQILANQANGLKGHGPVSPGGKSKSSRNALKTGMYAKLLLLPDEPEQEFDRLRAALYDEWRPVGQMEIIQVERLKALFWWQRRLYRTDAGLYAVHRVCSDGVGGVATAFDKALAFDRLMKRDVAIERSIGIALGRLQQLQEDRDKRAGLAAPPPTADPPCPAI